MIPSLMPGPGGENSERKAKSLIQNIKYIISHKTSITALYLYVIHFLNYVLPAVNVALLTRRLSPTSYGLLIIAQSLGLTVGSITEYGFRWTGARAVAESAVGSTLGPLVSSINAAKILIASACSILIPVYLLCIRSISGHVWLVVGGYIWGVVQGCDLQWYFLGRERLRGYLAVDVVMRALATGLIATLIRGDRDVSKVLLIQAICTLGVLVWAMQRVTAEVGLARPTKKGITEAMRDGGTLFLQNVARYATSTVNVAVLGMVASPAEVGFFGSADKLVRYLSFLNVPITQVVYPKISKNVGQAGRQANRLARLAGTISLIMAAIITAALFIMPRTIIRTLYGAKMLPALSSLRVLAIFPVLNSLTTSLVYYWLLPQRMERTSLRVMVIAGIINVIGVTALGRVWHQTGAATAVVLTEAITLILYLLALRSIGVSEHRDAEFASLAGKAT
jgi:PST family polysaccharide transporter